MFDLDGTLLDSDAALAAAFVALGIERSAITFGHVIAEECERLGITLDDYLEAYDVHAAQPYPGVEPMLASIERWAVCSNKHPRSGHDELARLGWRPEVVRFADAFDGPKRLDVMLEALDLPPSAVLYVGDTDHDRHAAAAVGCRFVLAGWNPRAQPRSGDEVANDPNQIVSACAGQSLA